MPKITRFETWKEACRQLEEASNALDQTHASMKDIGLENYAIRTQLFRHLTITNVHAYAGMLLHELKTAECPECDHPISEHTHGCKHDSSGNWQPCRCEWAQQAIGPKDSGRERITPESIANAR